MELTSQVSCSRSTVVDPAHSPRRTQLVALPGADPVLPTPCNKARERTRCKPQEPPTPCLSLSLQRGKLRSSQVPGILLSTGQPNTDNQPSYFLCCCTNAVSCGHRASVCVRLLGMCRPWKGTVGFLCQAKAEKGEKIFHFIDARECNSRGRKIFQFGEENTSILRAKYFHGY